MRKVAVCIIICIILSSFARAGWDPDTWCSGSMFACEAAAGAGLGLCLAAAASYGEDDDAGPNWLALTGFAVGSAGGVILVGEFFDDRSPNWYVTYPVTFAGASILPVTFGVIAERSDLDEAYWAALLMAFTTPIVTAATYNLVKEKVEETWTVRHEGEVRPYAGLLPDTGGGYVPVCGLSASF
ncbi:MAG: hypothetical protein JSU81_06500 [Candidatus Coatesbacteria bacterium]|nr:MAG: hypothetical protein JSU81_06500 [Candidatus Coatesbacteria bacterium]